MFAALPGQQFQAPLKAPIPMNTTALPLAKQPSFTPRREQALRAIVRFLPVGVMTCLVHFLALNVFTDVGLNLYAWHIVAMPLYALMLYARAPVLARAGGNEPTMRFSFLAWLTGEIPGFHPDWDKHRQQYIAFFLLLFCASIVVLFYRLTALPIELWDESRLANNALEMSHTGFSLITTYDWLPDHWNTKPPLLIWIMAASMKLSGINELGVRLPSVMASMATVVAVYLFVARYFQLPVQAFVAALILLATPGYIHAHGARSGNYEALLILCTTVFLLSAFLFLEGEETKKRRYFAVMAVAIVATFYTKAIQGLIFLPALFAYALLRGRIVMVLSKRYFYVGCVLVIASCAGYYWFRNYIDPGYFAAVQANDLGGRYSAPQEGHAGGPLWYLNSYKYFPWLIPGFLMGIYLCFKGSQESRKFALFLTVTSLTYFVVISSASTKLAWYAMPLAPLSAITCAFGFGRVAAALRAGAPDGMPLRSIVLLAIAGTIAVIASNIAWVDRAIAWKQQYPHDQHSYALRTMLDNGDKYRALVVVHPGYTSGPGSGFYVAPTMFYANALTIAGTPTTIVQHAAGVNKKATILACGDEGAIHGATLVSISSNKSKCVLHVSDADIAIFEGIPAGSVH